MTIRNGAPKKSPTSGNRGLGNRVPNLHAQPFPRRSTSRSPGLQHRTYRPRLPIPTLRDSGDCGFRSCSQLRGSAGFSPASISHFNRNEITRVLMNFTQYNRRQSACQENYAELIQKLPIDAEPERSRRHEESGHKLVTSIQQILPGNVKRGI